MNKINASSASLVIVGSGIKFLSHLTIEARAYIYNSAKVLYLVNDPAMKEWIIENNKNSESLDHIYNQHHLRKTSYQAITDYILHTLRRNLHVCVVIYGHPTFLAQPTLEAIIQARKEGFYAIALPGISAEACLYADLLIDPGTCGSQSFEATDFLLRKRKFDASSHLILYQVCHLGIISHDAPQKEHTVKAMHLLLKYLLNFYALNHKVFIYEAAQYPSFDPRIEQIDLGFLPEASLTPLTTLYIPPAYKAASDKHLLEVFRINIKDIKNDKK